MSENLNLSAVYDFCASRPGMVILSFGIAAVTGRAENPCVMDQFKVHLPVFERNREHSNDVCALRWCAVHGDQLVRHSKTKTKRTLRARIVL